MTQISDLFEHVLNFGSDWQVTKVEVDASSNVPLYKIEIYKNTSNSVRVGGEVMTTPPISLTAPSGNIPAVNTIKVVIDRSTAIVGWPGIINSGTTKVDVQYRDGQQNLRNDGHKRQCQVKKHSSN